MIVLFQFGILVVLLTVVAYMMVVTYLVYKGSNYLPTPKKEIETALQVLHKDDVFIDLGFGNGEVMQAAFKHGARTIIGYELDFTRFLRTWLRLRRDHFNGYHLQYADIWSANLSSADVVFTFFTIIHMKKLYAKAKREMKKGSWFISYVHEVPGQKPTRQVGKVRFFKM